MKTFAISSNQIGAFHQLSKWGHLILPETNINIAIEDGKPFPRVVFFGIQSHPEDIPG